jgi:pimeloyl-ACP methyl ester carboxylesterase
MWDLFSLACGNNRSKIMFLSVQNVQVYLEDSGSGSPILFLHGFPDSAKMWDGVIERLEGQYRCLAPDLPGLGRSIAPKDFECSLEHMASFVDKLVEAINPELPLSLVAADFGATYGLAWAVAHPQKVRRILIAGGSNFSSHYRWHRDARMLRTPLLGDLAAAMMTRSMFVKSMVASTPTLGPEHFGAVYDLSVSKPSVRRMMLRLYRSISPESFPGWEDRLATLTRAVPTYVLWGDKDPYISLDGAERFGSAQVEHFAENGHWLAIEEPEIVAQRLEAFFAAEIEAN